ncbi:MAG: MBG domain-containing protein [Lachnospira sp.]
MRKRRGFTQVTAALLATLMVFTNVDMAAFAVTEGSGTSTGSTTASYINSVTALQEDIAVQELEVGSSEADIVMPSVLDASVTQYTTINIQTPTQTPTQGATQPATTSTTSTTQSTTQTTTLSGQNTTQTTTSDQNTNQSTTQTSTSNQNTTSDQNSTQSSTGASGTESTSAQSESQAFNISQHNDREETSSSGSTGTTGTTNNTGNNGNSASNAKTVASTKQMELPVTWKIDTEKSTASEFSSVKAGAVYVYTPVFAEDIFVLDDIVIPSITVTIVKKKEVEFSQSSTIDGVTITVTADKGVFPEGVTLSVKKITDDATVKQLTEAAETAEAEAAASAAQVLSDDESEQNSDTENREIISEDVYVYDITILDKNGNEIQPDESKGTVTVTFTNPEPEKYDATDMSVFHVDENTMQATQLDTQVNTTENSVQAQAVHFSPYVLKLAKAANTITLYTAGGVIKNYQWTEEATGKYTSSTETEFPTVTMSDAATTFDGWYTDNSYSGGKVTTPIAGGTYYAKWTRTSTTVTGSTMKYSYSSSSMDSVGIINGRDIKTTFFSGGYRAYYAFNSSASGSGTLIYTSTGSDIYVSVGNDVYVAQVASFQGQFVKYTYYIWNKGTSQVSDFNLGAAADVQIGNNDHAQLILETEEGAAYVLMRDDSSEFRLYYNNVDGVTGVSTLWTGRYSKHTSNIFNDNRQNQSGIDSTVAFSWKNISIPANGVVAKSVLVGCGSSGSLSVKKTVTVKKDGTDESVIIEDGDSYTIPEAVLKDGCRFLGWNTAADGSEDMYQPGEQIYPDDSITLYPIYEYIKNTAYVTLNLDGSLWDGQNVQLYQNNSLKYTLSYANGSYENHDVINGTYDIYVNGRKSDKTITVSSIQESISVRQTVDYNKVTITTNLNGTPSSVPGLVVMRQNNRVVYVPEGSDGVYIEYIQASEGSYDIFVAGEDTGVDISAASPAMEVNYINVQVDITDDVPWENAFVQLKDNSGRIYAVLEKSSVNGNTVTYSKVIQRKAPATYSVYVDGIDTHKSVTNGDTGNTTQITYYTAKVTIKGDVLNVDITITNDVEEYAFSEDGSGTAGDGIHTYKAEHVLINDSGSSEKDYTVTVKNTVDENPEKISSNDKEKTIQLWKVQYKRYVKNTSDKTNKIGTDEVLDTVYVRDGNLLPVYRNKANLNGYTFNCWSKTRWSEKEDEIEGGAAYDFAQPVNQDFDLYANFYKPTIIIGDVIYTDDSGAISVDGTCYRMANTIISGFEQGDDAIKRIFLTTTNTESIIINETNNLTVINGVASANPEDGKYTITPSDDKVTIEFTNSISMAEAQDFLRNKIIVKYKTDVEHMMMVEVTDASGQYVAVNGVTAKVGTSESAAKITSSTHYLYSGTYYLDSNVTVSSYSSSSSSSRDRSALIVSDNATVYIYIPNGVTLTATGGNGSGIYGGGAGIYVPSGAKLVLLGSGTIKATGGRAGDGQQGGTGGDGGYSTGSTDYYYGGKGGDGGAGGGGAGAGIGTSGGTGGASKTGPSKNTQVASDGGSGISSGTSGYQGNWGSAAASMGTVEIASSITKNISGGSSGSRGEAGSAGEPWSNRYIDVWQVCWAGGAGGGGGGGGAGYAGANIGTGGAGGGSGGTGASGGTWSNSTKKGDYKGTWYIKNGYGGSGGTGATNGAAGYGGNSFGQSGGSGGSSYGSTGTSNSNTALKDADKKKYTISFSNITSTSTAPASLNYYFGESYTITFPEYQDSNPDVIFYGWQLQTYAKSAKSGSPLTTSTDKTRYQPNNTVTLDPSTYGNITFVAVTETIGGIRDDDTNKVTINTSADKNISYFKYNVKFTLDGNDTTVNNVKIGDKSVAPSQDGSYSLIVQTTNDSSHNPVKPDNLAIYIDGEYVGTTAYFSEVADDDGIFNSDTTIEYETLKVKVTGKEPSSVRLAQAYDASGIAVPSLITVDIDGNSYTYSTKRFKDNIKGKFNIYVDGEDVGKTVSYGEEKVVNYYTTTVNITTDGISTNDIDRVELRDASGNSLYMNGSKYGVTNTCSYSLTLLSHDTEYYIYINGEKKYDSAVTFKQDNTVNITYVHRTTSVKTYIDGELADIGTVTLGQTKMVRESVGTYSLVSTEQGTGDISVDGVTRKKGVSYGSNIECNYYTVTYKIPEDSSATGVVPVDDAIYYSGTGVTVQGQAGIVNGGLTFAGWAVEGEESSTTYAEGSSYTITKTSTLVPVWEKTDISGLEIELETVDYTYNGESQKPDVTVTDKVRDKVLVEGTDYTLSYSNTNTTGGREDNTINAGDITITVTGIGDYTGGYSGENTKYTIGKKTISVDNLKAVDREYNGSTKIEIKAAEAVLSGVVTGDDVELLASSEGEVYSPNARANKYVIVNGEAQLTGENSSNYDLEPLADITVTITPKTLTADMFTVADTIGGKAIVYNGAEQTPEITSEDLATVENEETHIDEQKNIIDPSDYFVTYSDNIHAGRGVVTITADDEEGVDHNYVGSVTLEFDIAKAPLTITAEAASSVYGKDIAELSYNVSSGSIYTDSDKTDLDIKAVTSVKTGYGVNTYSDAVSIEYNASNTDYDVTTVAADYKITPAGELEVTAKGYTGVYDGNEHSIEVTADTFDYNDTVRVYYSTSTELNVGNYSSAGSTTNPAFKNAGEYTVYYFAKTDNYTGTPGSAKVIITKAPLTVTANKHTITYGDSVSDLPDTGFAGVTISGFVNGETPSDLTLSGQLSYTSEDYAQFGDVGTYTCKPSGNITSANYDISYRAGELEVKPKNITFIWNGNDSYAYTGSSQGVTASVNGVVNGDDVTVASYEENRADNVCVGAKDAGSYTAKITGITGKKAGNYVYSDSESTLTKAWSITKAENAWIIEPSIQNWTAGSTASSPVSAAKYGSPVYTYAQITTNEETQEVVGEYTDTKPTEAGKYSMKAVVEETDNYGGLEKTVEFQITASSGKTKVRVVVSDKTITYGGDLDVNSIVVGYKDESGNDVTLTDGSVTGSLTYNTNYIKGNAVNGRAGTYVITASGLSSETYEFIYETAVLTVNKKEVSLAWSDDSLEYTGNEQAVTASVNSSDIINGDNIYVGTYENAKATEVGGYTAKALTLSGTNADNYTLGTGETVSHGWQITSAQNAFVIQPYIQGWIYGEESSTPVATAKFGEVKFTYKKNNAGGSEDNTPSQTEPSDAGEYVLVATVEGTGSYNELTKEVPFAIGRAKAIVTANDGSGVYGTVPSGLTADVTVIRGKVTDEDKAALGITVSVDPQDATLELDKLPVGVYPAKVTVTASSDSNIEVETVDGTYRVTPASLTVTASDASYVYDGTAHSITAPVVKAGGAELSLAVIYYSTSELNSTNYGSGSLTPPTITNAGSTGIYYYVKAENYEDNKGSVTLSVTPKEVTVTAKPAEVTFGSDAANQGVTYEGFIGDDSAESENVTVGYVYKTNDSTASSGTAYAKGSKVGTYKIFPVITTAEGKNNYSYTPVAGTLTVSKKALSEDMFGLSIPEGGYTYSGNGYEPDVTKTTVDSYLDNTDFAVTYEDNIHAGNDAKVVITATDNGNYSGSIIKKFGIQAKAITVRANAATSAYMADIASLSYTIDGINGQAAETVASELNLKAVTSVKKGYAKGTYEDAVSVEYDVDNYDYRVSVVPADYTVTESTLQASVKAYEGVYDGKEHSPVISVKAGEADSTVTIYYSTSEAVTADNYQRMATVIPSFKDAGTYTLYYYAVCDNYQPVSGSVDVKITKAVLTVKAGSTEITYGMDSSEINSKLTALADSSDGFTYEGFVEGDTKESVFADVSQAARLGLTTDYVQYGDAGTYRTYVNDQSLSLTNYEIKKVSGTLKVNPKNVTFSWSEQAENLPYTGSVQGIKAAINASDIVVNTGVADDVRVGSYEEDRANNICADAKEVGSYTAKIKSLTGAKASNYTFTPGDGDTVKNWSIGQASNEWTITPSIQSWTEGGTAAEPVAAAKYGEVQFAYSTSETGTYSGDKPQTAGTYWMKAEVAESGSYAGLTKTVQFTIKVRPAGEIKTITVTAPSVGVDYGDTLDTSGYTVANITDAGLVAGLPDGIALADIIDLTAVLGFTTDYAIGNSVGTYMIVPEGLSVKAEKQSEFEIIYAPGTVTVNKKEISLTWSGTEYTYDGKEHEVTASVDSNELYSGDSIEVTGYEYRQADKIQNSATDVGEYTAHAVSFTGVNWNNYTIKTDSANHTWKISKASGSGQGVGNTFVMEPSIDGWTYGQTASTPEGESRFGTPVYLYSSSVDGAYTQTVPTAAGTYYMKAKVAGTDNYDEIISDAYEFEVSKAKITAVADDVTVSYGSPVSELTYSVSGQIKQGDDLKLKAVTTATAQSNVGSYPITFEWEENTNYDVTFVEAVYYVKAGTSGLNVTASGYTNKYDGNGHGITVTVKDSNGNNINDAVVYYSETPLNSTNYGSGSTSSPKYTDVGERTVYYYVHTVNYEGVAGSKTVNISKKPVKVIANDNSITYGQEPSENGVRFDGFEGTDSAASLGLAPAYTYTYTQYQKTGTYKITPGGLSEDGNYTYQYVSGYLRVNAKNLTFEWSDNAYVYDGTGKVMTASPVGLESTDSVTLEYEGNTATAVGGYTAKVTGLAGDNADNYTIASDERSAVQTWSISKGTNYLATPLTMDNWTYGDTPSEPAGNAAYGTTRYVYSESRSGEYTSSQPVDAGTYFVKIVVDGTADYDYFESAPVSFTISKAEITVTADDITAKQGSDIKELTYTITGNVKSGDELQITLNTTADKDTVGDYPISITYVADSNYTINVVSGTYHVIDLDLDVSVAIADYVYDGTEHGITVTLTGEDAGNARVYYSLEKLTDLSAVARLGSASEVCPGIKDVGSKRVYYYVVQSGETSEGEESSEGGASSEGGTSSANGQLLVSGSKLVNITKATLTVTANDKTIKMGDSPADDGVTYEGFVTGENESILSGTLQYTYDYVKGQIYGSYKIMPSGLTSDNYNIIYKPGVLTVNAVAQDIAVIGVQITTKDYVYDGEPHSGYTGTPSLSDGGTTEFVISYKDADGIQLYSQPVNAGEYKLVVSVADDNPLYKGEVEFGFNITKRPVTVKAVNQAIMAGQAFAAVDAEYEGFLGDDNKDNKAIDGKPTVTPESGANIAVAGKYALKVTDVGTLKDVSPQPQNYVLSGTKDGVLTVIAKPSEGGSGSGSGSGSGENPGGDEDTGGSVKFDTPDSGVVKTAVIKDEERLPDTRLQTNLTVELAEKLLDSSEVTAVQSGKDALIYLMLSDADETDSSISQDVNAIKDTALTVDLDMQIGANLDVSLFKKVGDAAPEKISETGEAKVTVYITLPDELKQTDSSVNRTYYIFFCHNGVVDKITPAYDSQKGVLSFAADRFSVYTIAYVDKTSGGDNPVIPPVNPEEPTTPVAPEEPTTPVVPEEPTTPVAPENPTTPGIPDAPDSPVEDTPESDNPAQPSGPSRPDNNGNSGNGNNTDVSGGTQGDSGASAGGSDSISGGSGSTPGDNIEVAEAEPGADKPDNSGNKPDSSGRIPTGDADVISPDNVPEDIQSKLNDAVDLIKTIDPSIEPGAIIKIDNDGYEEGETVRITVKIPDELLASGRTFYAVTVDGDGNIIVLTNESIEEGTLTITGKAGAYYAIVYEDGTGRLADMLTADGKVLSSDGSTLQIKPDKCFMHWIILLIALAGIILELLLKRKKLVQIAAMALLAVAMVICIIPGSCIYDIVLAVLGILAMMFVKVLLLEGKR